MKIWTAIILGFAAFAAAAATLGGPGPVWDEPFSLVASESYAGWLAHPSFSKQAIDQAWSVNHEHPPLAKAWIGLVRHAVQAVWPGADDLLASRLATAMLYGLLVGLVAAFAWNLGEAGIVAGLFALFMPRLFSDAHFATLDLAMALAWFATAYAFAKGIRSRGWAIAAGFIFGAALLTKINAVFIPVPLVLWAAIFHRRKAIVPIALLAIGPIVFLAGWPWLWHDTASRLGGYLFGTTLGRAVVPVCYLGTIYSERYAPWHYPFVLTLFTIPLGTLACLCLGLWSSISRRRKPAALRQSAAGPDLRREFLALAVLSFAAILIVAALPFAPKYDGVRLFLAVFPFAACLAGAGAMAVWERLRPARLTVTAAVVFVALQSAGILAYHPYQTSYYNLLCGGLPGAAKLGLEATYWCDVYSRPVFTFVNGLPAGTRVAFYPVGDFHYQFYQLAGYVSREIRLVDFRKGTFDYAVLMNRQGILLQDEKAARLFRENDAMRVLTIERMGTALCVIRRAE